MVDGANRTVMPQKNTTVAYIEQLPDYYSTYVLYCKYFYPFSLW
jgi:hypothetical protein